MSEYQNLPTPDRGDVVVRGAAVQNIRNIANKFDEHRTNLVRSEFALAREVADENITEADYHQAVARLRGDALDVARRLLHGLATTFEVSRSGVVVAEDDTSLVGSGYLTVGLVDHGTNWSVHS